MKTTEENDQMDPVTMSFAYAFRPLVRSGSVWFVLGQP